MLTGKALKLRLDKMLREAKSCYDRNKYVTIYDECSLEQFRGQYVYTVRIDLNFPVYVLQDGVPTLKQGIHDVRIIYRQSYPNESPIIIFPEILASIHSSDDYQVSIPQSYVPFADNLVKTIFKVMILAANCTEAICFSSLNPERRCLIDWTKSSLESGLLPTVSYSELSDTLSKPKRRIKSCGEV